MTKLPPFIARQQRRRRTERRRAAQRARSRRAYVRLLDDIMALDPATRMLPSGVH